MTTISIQYYICFKQVERLCYKGDVKTIKHKAKIKIDEFLLMKEKSVYVPVYLIHVSKCPLIEFLLVVI